MSFDPNFDDRVWSADWLEIPVALAPPGLHPSGYRLERRLLDTVEIFGQFYHMTPPFDCRLLIDPDDNLWMSNTPQEHIMMYNSALRTQGHVLVGGLGLGVYPQYAALAGAAKRITVIEYSPVVRDLIEPTLSAALPIPLDVQIGDLADVLDGPVSTRYDTIFLDTWPTLDATHLPAINALRDQALRHLAPGGIVLLWGYRWMVDLFEQACAQVLSVPPAQRIAWLAAAQANSQAEALLQPVVDHFRDQEIDDLDAALAWCREYIIYHS